MSSSKNPANCYDKIAIDAEVQRGVKLTKTPVEVRSCTWLRFEEVKVIINDNNKRPEGNKLFKLNLSNELLMAIAARESGKAVQPGGKHEKITDIKFDPCAQNEVSSGIGLMQVLSKYFPEYIDQGYIISEELPELTHARMCGNPELAVTYALAVLEEKYEYKRKFEGNERMVEMIAGYKGGSYVYAHNAIQIAIAFKEKGYEKSVLLDKLNEQLQAKAISKSKARSKAIAALVKAQENGIIIVEDITISDEGQ